MKLIILFTVMAPFFADAKTIYQCAIENVVPHGARVNVIEAKGQVRANLIFGTTVSGTMYNVSPSATGYAGAIRNKPEFTFNLEITDTKAENANIRGYQAHLTAVYPTALNNNGFEQIETDLVCGEKISGRWQ